MTFSATVYSNTIVSISHWNNVKNSGKFDKTRLNADFDCSNNKLNDMSGFPNIITGNFLCNNNNIKTFEGAPKYVGGRFDMSNNQITSLKNIHKHIKLIPEGNIILGGNPIESNILGLLLISGLHHIMGFDLSPAFNILRYHMAIERDVLACQEDLIAAGYKEFAKL